MPFLGQEVRVPRPIELSGSQSRLNPREPMIKFGYPLRNKIFDVLKVFMYIYYIKLNEISDVGSNFYLFYNI